MRPNLKRGKKMTTWTTFQTLDETIKETGRAFCVDRLGCFQRVEDSRTRFVFTKEDLSTWTVIDKEPPEGQVTAYQSIMYDCVAFMAARVLYGA